tara:strand:- start:1713 stop:2264 length:552 start_codon:yes stop_codon:yes gene_type:complete
MKHKTLLKPLLVVLLLLKTAVFSTLSYAENLSFNNLSYNNVTAVATSITPVANPSNQQAVKTFYLQLWAPDQVAPADATPVEYGANYQYRYTPESHEVAAGNGAELIGFEFHPALKKRYQFRWISSDQPHLVSFDKIKKRKMNVRVDIDSNNQAQDIYFEVWVYDTLTGEVLMCDPRVRIIKT